MAPRPRMDSGHSPSWQAIFDRYNIHEHDFNAGPFDITAVQIRDACQHFQRTSEKEVRILCKQDTRESRPQVFRDRDLFILPIRNGAYTIVQGEGYVDVPSIGTPIQDYISEFPFDLETSRVGNSEMQHLDWAYALSLIRHFSEDQSLVLTIRGRKYTPGFDFVTGEFLVHVEGVQTEVDAGYEGQNQVVLVEAKGGRATNTIIRQLYYPFRQWQNYTDKRVSTFFFQWAGNNVINLWQFVFDREEDYNSIRLLRSGRYRIVRRQL